jgi:hypothetical protein
MSDRLFKLRVNETVAIYDLAPRGPGTYVLPLWAEGNALVSTLFVEALDPGASISVTFDDQGMSDNPADSVALGGHETITTPLKASKTAITRFHSRPTIKTIVTGGRVTWGQWLTLKTEYVPITATNSGETLVYTGTTTPGTITAFPPTPDKLIQQLSVRAVTDQASGHRLKVSLDGQANWLTLSPGEIFAIMPRGELRQIFVDGLTNSTAYEVILLIGQ